MLILDLRKIARSQCKSARVDSGLTEGEVALATSKEGKPLPAEISWSGDGGALGKSSIYRSSMNKSKLPLIIELLKPSGLSFMLTSITSVFLLLMGTGRALGSSERLFELILGDYASGSLLEITKRDFLDAFSFFDNAFLNNFLLAMFWAMVGAITWYILTRAISLFDEINDDINEVSYRKQGLRHDSHHLIETLTKFFYHLGLLVVVLVYVYFLRSVIAQWLSDVFISGMGVKLTISGGAIMLLAIAGMTLALHGLTLLLRLLFARQRLFG